MKDTPAQLDMRENTASTGRHASRRITNVPTARPVQLVMTERQDKTGKTLLPRVGQEFDLPLTEPDKGTTGGRGSASNSPKGTNQPNVERPLTCEEAAAIVRVHPKTVKRMARNGELPGHFRFGRWFFYASELDCWMRMELHSARHP
jgi:excisionase family DNA binding protein